MNSGVARSGAIGSGVAQAARVVRPRTDFSDIEALANLLDSRWAIPGTKFRFGLDAVIGLVPALGDLSTAIVSAYIIFRAKELGVSRAILTRMGANVAIDTLIGSVPILGSIFDIFFKANKKNVRLLRRHIELLPTPR